MSCSCMSEEPPDVAFKNMEAVFIGKVISIENNSVYEETENGFSYTSASNIQVKFEIITSYKGDRAEQTIINTGVGGGDCGYEFILGKKYVVYAYFRDKGKKELATNICVRTDLLENAKEDIAFFKTIEKR